MYTPFSFFGSQTQSEAVITIPTNGLQMYVTATEQASYPGSGSLWYDLSGNGNHVALTGSFDFSSSQAINIPFSTYAMGTPGTNSLDLFSISSSISVVTIFKSARPLLPTEDGAQAYLVSKNAWYSTEDKPVGGDFASSGWNVAYANEGEGGFTRNATSKSLAWTLNGTTQADTDFRNTKQTTLRYVSASWNSLTTVYDGAGSGSASFMYQYFGPQTSSYWGTEWTVTRQFSQNPSFINPGSTTQTPAPLTIGWRDPLSPSSFKDDRTRFTGSIGAVLVYNRVLTPVEISDINYVLGPYFSPNYLPPPPISYTADYLIVAGGGGTSKNGSGGGGAGGLRSGSVTFTTGSVSTLSVIIGAGGAGQSDIAGANGNSSSFNSTSSIGGGGAGGGLGGPEDQGKNGGSGGGSHRTATAGTGSSGQGFAGAQGASTGESNGGGGGGASSAGLIGSGSGSITTGYSLGGNGGSGSQWLNGTFYAGGGGGGGANSGSIANTGSLGGIGGGGNGGWNVPGTSRAFDSTGSNGQTNTGGGAGGSGAEYEGVGANGGSGIVVIRYPEYISGATIATGGVITSASGYIYHTFTSSGNFTTYK